MSGDNEANPMLRLQMAAQIQVHNLEEFCQVDNMNWALDGPVTGVQYICIADGSIVHYICISAESAALLSTDFSIDDATWNRQTAK